MEKSQANRFPIDQLFNGYIYLCQVEWLGRGDRGIADDARHAVFPPVAVVRKSSTGKNILFKSLSFDPFVR